MKSFQCFENLSITKLQRKTSDFSDLMLEANLIVTGICFASESLLKDGAAVSVLLNVVECFDPIMYPEIHALLKFEFSF